jgi:hypothetical protein
MNGKEHDPSLENLMPPSYPELGARVHVLEVRMMTVEKDIAVIRATCATKDDVALILEKISRLSDEMYKGQADIYKHLSVLAWRVYGVIALAMSAAYFIARYVH